MEQVPISENQTADTTSQVKKDYSDLTMAAVANPLMDF